MTNRYKKLLTYKIKVSAKINLRQKNSYIFLHNNDCETPYIDIYIDLLSIYFNLLSVLLHCAYHQISDYEIYTALSNSMLAKYIVLSNINSVVSENILRIYIQERLLILKIFIVLHTLSAYNSLLVRYKVYLSDPRECLCTR